MKYNGRNNKINRMVFDKHTKKYQLNIKIITFLKSNYKYKRRCLRNLITNDKLSIQHNSSLRRQIHNKQMQKQKYQLLVEKDMFWNNKKFVQKVHIYDNTRLDKFLRILILIMQQAKSTTTRIKNTNNTRKYVNNGLPSRVVIKTNAIKNTNRSSSTSNVDENEISGNHCAYKDANKDTDINTNNIGCTDDEISHQQHNYDKVSTITSPPIKCQRRKHIQIKTTKKSATTLSSPSYTPPFTPLTSPTTKPTSLSSPSVVFQTNYETSQWSATLRKCICGSPPIHHQNHYNQRHYKSKHIQHHQFYQQHQQQGHYWRQHTFSLKCTSLLSAKSNNNKSDTSSIKTKNRSDLSYTIGSSTFSSRAAALQSIDQYVNATWNCSYTISCLLLTLFIVSTIGIQSTTGK